MSKPLNFTYRIAPLLLVGTLGLAAFFYEIARAVEKDDFAPQVEIPIQLQLKPAIQLTSDRIYLGDLAECVGYDVLCEEAYGIDLGQSPLPGRQIYFNQDQIIDVLAREWPKVKVQITGPERIKLVSKSIEIDSEIVRESLEPYILAFNSERSNIRLVIKSVKVSPPVKVWPGEFRLRFLDFETLDAASESWITYKMNGTRRFDFIYIHEDGYEAQYSAAINIRVEANTAVAVQNLARGHRLVAADVKPQWVEVKKHQTNWVSMADSLGKSLSKDIRLGAVISKKDLQLEETVKRGSMLNMIMKNSVIKLTGKVRTLKAAKVGSTVPVEYLQTKKKFVGRLIDKNSVEIIW